MCYALTVKFHLLQHRFLRAFLCLAIFASYFVTAPKAEAAIAHVQSTYDYNLSTGSSFGKAFAGSVTAGNTVIVATSTWNGGGTATVTSVTDSQGNVYTKADEYLVNGEKLAVWYHIGIASSGSLTVTANTGPPADITIGIHEYSGIASIDQHTTGASGGTALSAGPVTTTSADELIFGAFNNDTGGTFTPTVGSGFTARVQQNDNSAHEDLWTQDKIVSSIGAYSSDMTVTPTSSWAAIIVTFAPSVATGNPFSTTYKIQSYQFGGGGLATAAAGLSSHYALNANIGQVESASASSTHYVTNNGITYLQMANVPPAPTFTNPSSFADKLQIVINTGGNPSDTKYAIAVSSNAFVSSTQYVQADSTLGSTPVFQTNAVWGASGFNVIGLAAGTTYSAKVTAKQGNFSQSNFGNFAQASTINTSFSLSITPNTVSIGSLTPGSVVTAGTTVTSTISTNGSGGGTIYVYDSNTGLLSSSTSYTISSVSNDLSSISEGYGLRGTSTSQSSGGPMRIISPYNGASNNVGIIDSTKRPIFDSTGAAVTSGTATFEVKAKASNVAKAATDYSDILTIIGSATF